MQVTADDVISEQSSSCGKATVCAARSAQASHLRSQLAKQKFTSKCNVNTVGSNPVEISRLHMKNSIRYLRFKCEVEAAGESVCNLCFLVLHVKLLGFLCTAQLYLCIVCIDIIVSSV